MSVVVATALAVAGCGRAAPSTTPATPATGGLPASTTTSPSTVHSTTTTTIDVTRVPAHITIAYVTAVLAVLNHVYGDAVRAAVATKRLSETATRDLGAIYEPGELSKQEIAFAQVLQGNLSDVRRDPGDPVMTVVSLSTATSSCIFAKVRTNSNRIVRRRVAPLGSEYVELRFAGDADPGAINTTPWLIALDDAFVAPIQEASKCQSS